MTGNMIEIYIRQLVREEVQKALSEMCITEKKESPVNQYPPFLTVEEAASIMRLGRNTVYEMAHDPTFPAIREGRKIRIPTQALFSWLESRQQNNMAREA